MITFHEMLNNYCVRQKAYLDKIQPPHKKVHLNNSFYNLKKATICLFKSHCESGTLCTILHVLLLHVILGKVMADT